jgi:hypothetical protein
MHLPLFNFNAFPDQEGEGISNIKKQRNKEGDFQIYPAKDMILLWE